MLIHSSFIFKRHIFLSDVYFVRLLVCPSLLAGYYKNNLIDFSEIWWPKKDMVHYIISFSAVSIMKPFIFPLIAELWGGEAKLSLSWNLFNTYLHICHTHFCLLRFSSTPPTNLSNIQQMWLLKYLDSF